MVDIGGNVLSLGGLWHSFASKKLRQCSQGPVTPRPGHQKSTPPAFPALGCSIDLFGESNDEDRGARASPSLG
jgi:hypothetical protein